MDKFVKRFQGLSKKVRISLMLGFLAILALVPVLVFNFSPKSSQETIVLGVKSDSISGPLADFDLSSLEDIEVFEEEASIGDGGFDFNFDLSFNESFLNSSVPLSLGQELVKVLRVIDGDTFELDLNGSKTTVRIIGINAPEKNECLYSEAVSFAEKLAGQDVYIFTDESQPSKDKYNRTLLYIKTKDNKDFGSELLKAGLAREYTYGQDYELKAYYIVAQNAAQIEAKGIWGEKCNKDNEKSSKPQDVNASPIKNKTQEEAPKEPVEADKIEYPISINTATEKDLQNLPGIGEVKAQAIADYRDEHGNFTKKEDIVNVSGIGSVTYEKIKDLITI